MRTTFTQGYPDKSGWVTSFGNRRIKGLWHLPDEYRRHMRPSSAKISKASIIGIMSRIKKLIHATNLNWESRCMKSSLHLSRSQIKNLELRI